MADPSPQTSETPKPPRRPRRRIPVGRLVSAIVGILVLVAIVIGLIWYGAGADQRGDSSEFSAKQEPGARRLSRDVGTAAWPTWGLNTRRDRYVENSPLKPPFHQLWKQRIGHLIEFPPAVGIKALYVPDSDGTLHALDRLSGESLWTAHLPGALASSPTVVGDTVVQAAKDGRVYGFDVHDGKKLWTFRGADGPIESSPLAVGRKLIFGSHDHKLYAISLKTRRIAWTVEGDDAFKGSVAYADGVVYAGNYDGKLYAVRLTDGAVL